MGLPQLAGIGLAESYRFKQSEILKIDNSPIQNATQRSGIHGFSTPKKDSGIHNGQQVEKGIGTEDTTGKQEQQCYEKHVPNALQVRYKKADSFKFEGEMRSYREYKRKHHQPDNSGTEKIHGCVRFSITQQYG
jgi:hypothetical protein